MDHDIHSIVKEDAEACQLTGATIIPFPMHRSKVRDASGDAAPVAQATLTQATLTHLRRPVNADVLQSLVQRLSYLAVEASADKRAGSTTLGALGGIAGFAAQQSLLLQGGATWGQPMRAAHLDRLLVSTAPDCDSLWHHLQQAANLSGPTKLPDPAKLLTATQRCIGTTQLGVITLPPQHRLSEQPQTGLTRLWARVRSVLDDAGTDARDWPKITSRAVALHLTAARQNVPIHVAVRIAMQAALAMALIEPRHIPGAAVRWA